MSSRGRVKLKRGFLFLPMRGCRVAAVLLLPVLLAACAVSNPFRSSSSDTATSAMPPPDQLQQITKTDAGTDIAGGGGAHCPQVVAWPADRLLTIYKGTVGDTLAVVHRGEITKLSRECQFSADRVIVKYGFAGRVLLGPKGQPGTVTLPVSIRASDSERKTLASDQMKISTTIPAGSLVGYFSMVKEISFPVRTGTRPEDYKVFVAFERTVPGSG